MLETGNYAQAAHANGKEGTMTAGMPKTDLFACAVPSSNAILASSSMPYLHCSFAACNLTQSTVLLILHYHTSHSITLHIPACCTGLVGLGWAGLGWVVLCDAMLCWCGAVRCCAVWCCVVLCGAEEYMTEFSMWAISASPLTVTTPIMNCTSAAPTPSPPVNAQHPLSLT
jgi:hypothetical protein